MPYSFWDAVNQRQTTVEPAAQIIPLPPANTVDGASPYGTKALADELYTLANTGEGARNDQLNRSAFNLAQLVAAGHLPPVETQQQLRTTALTIGLPAAEVDATLRSAFRAGTQHPRVVPEQPARVEVIETQINPETGEILNPSQAATEDETGRQLVLTPAALIKPKRVHWLWDGRIAIATLALLAGREGQGKSTLAYWMVAQITQGNLPGEHLGTPKSVLVCATEDSWEHTIVPRLIAAGADLERVYRVEIISDAVHHELTLPKDLPAVKKAAQETDASLLLLDPLMSRIDDKIDTHRDAETRRALEPLVATANHSNIAVLGLIHHNKSSSTDPLQLVMASKAFTAVARSVHTVIPDPDDETEHRRLFGTPKNNLGRTDLPTLAFTIESFQIATDEGDAYTGHIQWSGESLTSIAEAMRRAHDPEQNSATQEAANWLDDYLTHNGGNAASADIKRHGAAAGHSVDALKRARKRLGCPVEETGFPRRTYWLHPSESTQTP